MAFFVFIGQVVEFLGKLHRRESYSLFAPAIKWPAGGEDKFAGTDTQGEALVLDKLSDCQSLHQAFFRTE